jgi:hypothetical protein
MSDSHCRLTHGCSAERVEVRAPARLRSRSADGGGAEGNERLTASTAVALLVLLAIEGVTILSIRNLLPVHILVGIALIPPIALKLGSVAWRFGRYYLGTRAYRVKGPPTPFLRFLVAPLVVFSTLFLFGTGVALIAVGPRGGILLGLHKASFVIWFGSMAVHVLAHVLKLPRLSLADFRRGQRLGDARARAGALVASIAFGFLLAGAVYPSSTTWVHWAAQHHRHEGDG